MVFQAAHYNPMAGHLGYDKTSNQIMARFYWPGIRAEVRRWCASCPECQLVNPPAVPRAPLWPLPLVEAPFDRVGMDIIGPLERFAHGYRFVLVLIDYATRYPEAIPLRNISAKRSYRGRESRRTFSLTRAPISCHAQLRNFTGY